MASRPTCRAGQDAGRFAGYALTLVPLLRVRLGRGTALGPLTTATATDGGAGTSDRE